MNMNITDLVARAVAKQPWVVRRKDTIMTILTGVSWMVGWLLPLSANWDEVWTLVIGLAGTFAAALTTALTKGAFTPSMAERLEEFIPVNTVDELERLRDHMAEPEGV